MNQIKTMQITLGLLLFTPLFAAAEASYSQLNSCEQSIQGESFVFNHLIRNKDLLVIRQFRPNQEPKKIALNLNLFHKNAAYKVELPAVSNTYNLPHVFTVALPDGKYCMHYKDNVILEDQIRVFEKMPSSNCHSGNPELPAVAEKSSLDLFRTKIVQRMELQLKRINEYTEIIRNSPKAENVADAQQKLDASIAKLKSWNKAQCQSLNDPQISQLIRDIQVKVTAISPGGAPAVAQGTQQRRPARGTLN